MLFISSLCANQFLSKLLFIRHNDLNPAKLITVRNFFALLIVTAMMNKDFKYYMVDSVPREQYRSLAIRCFQGSFQFVCMYTCIKYFPVVIVTLVSNIGPLLIALFSFLLYKVSLSKLDVAILLVSFVGCIVLITGTLAPVKEDGVEYSTSDLILPTVFLVLVPINNACLNLYLRSMRDMSEITLGSYIIYAMFLAYAPFTVAYYGLDFVSDFTPTDWGICVLLGFTGSFLQIVKALSLKYEEPARLAALNYFQPIIQLVLDVIFLHSEFSNQEIVGCLIIFAANSISWLVKAKKAF